MNWIMCWCQVNHGTYWWSGMVQWTRTLPYLDRWVCGLALYLGCVFFKSAPSPVHWMHAHMQMFLLFISTVSLSTHLHFYIIFQQLADSWCLVWFCQLMSSLELFAKGNKAEVSVFLGVGTTSVDNCFLTFQQNVMFLISWESIIQWFVATCWKYSSLNYTRVKVEKLAK